MQSSTESFELWRKTKLVIWNMDHNLQITACWMTKTSHGVDQPLLKKNDHLFIMLLF